jgi:AraC-like DNA-binding protein
VLTDILLSEQRINRNAQHIAKLDKDCYYIQLLHSGTLNVLQHGESHTSNAARGALFCATEQYELQCVGDVRSFYLEIPRDKFAQRFPKDRKPLCAPIDCTRGLGRIATEFCASLAAEDPNLGNDTRAELGDQLLDILALTLLSNGSDILLSDRSVQKARLRSVQQWIEEHLGDLNLTLEKIAQANNMSLRYLHLLFSQIDMSVSNWLWDRRLQRCYSVIAGGDSRSITSIAFDHGFSSSAHFSTMFRRKYGFRPSDLRRSQ